VSRRAESKERLTEERQTKREFIFVDCIIVCFVCVCICYHRLCVCVQEYVNMVKSCRFVLSFLCTHERRERDVCVFFVCQQ
jgi:hypothetical protein